MWSVRISIQRNMKGNVTIGGHRCQQFEENGYFQRLPNRGSVQQWTRVDGDPRGSSIQQKSKRKFKRKSTPGTERGASTDQKRGLSFTWRWRVGGKTMDCKHFCWWNVWKQIHVQVKPFEIFYMTIWPIWFFPLNFTNYLLSFLRPDSLAYLAEDLSPTILPRGRGGKIYK